MFLKLLIYLFPFNVRHDPHDGYEAERHIKTFTLISSAPIPSVGCALEHCT